MSDRRWLASNESSSLARVALCEVDNKKGLTVRPVVGDISRCCANRACSIVVDRCEWKSLSVFKCEAEAKRLARLSQYYRLTWSLCSSKAIL